MISQPFKNLRDLFQNKYALQPRSNSRSSSISEVLRNMKKKDISPVPKSSLRDEIINFSKAVGLPTKTQRQKTPIQEKKPINYSVIQSSKGHSRNSSSQSRNTSSHSIVNERDQTNRSIKDPRIPPKSIQRMRDRNDVSLLIEPKANISIEKRPNSNVELFNLLKQQSDKHEKKSEEQMEDYCGVTKNHFTYHYVIGKGGFGKVWRVEMKKNKVQYAMKEMLKTKIIAKRSINSVMNEKHLLQQLKHPFLVNMSYAFQDRETLYLIMDLLTGGDLRFHIGRMRKFKEPQTKFFVACIFAGLEYLHNNNIIHRDIKPENIVLDKKGYARITDLGIARKSRPDNAQDTSGTPGYMAPEVMCRQNHGIAVDYFALGVITFEFMMGRRPYQGRSRKEIRDQILAKQAQVKKEEIPPGWSLEAVDFVNRLLQRKPQNRLGFNGPNEVKNHPWLKGFQWDKLLNKQLEAQFVPTNVDDMYRQQASDGEESLGEQMQENLQQLKDNSVQNLFAGYSYDGNVVVCRGNTKSTASTHNTSQQNEYLKL